MTNTPMTFEQWFMLQSKMVYRHPQEIAEIAWQASQAQQASEIEALKHDLYSYMEASNGYVNEIMKQAQTIAELVEALEFYASTKNWHKDSQQYGSFEISDYNIIYNDFYEQNQATRYAGKVAREALAKVKGK